MSKKGDGLVQTTSSRDTLKNRVGSIRNWGLKDKIIKNIEDRNNLKAKTIIYKKKNEKNQHKEYGVTQRRSTDKT